MAAKKNIKTETPLSQDPLETLQNNIKPISIIAISVLVIVILVITYTSYTSSRENEAWQAFNEFQNESMRALMVDQGSVQEFLTEIDGTDVEPWALSFCTSLYFSKRDFDRASQMLDRLHNEYGNHYICKDTNFYETARSMINTEIEWMDKNKPTEPDPAPEGENS
jgi:hypothetical protein